MLARLGPRRARASALGAMRALAALPLGDRFMETFGDLAPPPELALAIAGIDLASPIGVGGGLDVNVIATCALARLGPGYVEIGRSRALRSAAAGSRATATELWYTRRRSRTPV